MRGQCCAVSDQSYVFKLRVTVTAKVETLKVETVTPKCKNPRYLPGFRFAPLGVKMAAFDAPLRHSGTRVIVEYHNMKGLDRSHFENMNHPLAGLLFPGS